MLSITDLIQKSIQRKEPNERMLCHNCYSLVATKDEILRPFKVHRIMVSIENFQSDPRLLKIHNHVVEKPWRILTQYVNITKQTPYISLLLVSAINRRIVPNEEICHVSFIQPEEALYDLKGKYILALI
jgi:hypothetical protein